MVTFIVVDDVKEIRDKEKDIIEKHMMRYDAKYKVKTYDEYNAEFKKEITKEEGLKIYLLDIKTKKSSGIDIARMIREQYNDWRSIIVVITAYPEYKYEALGARLYILDFIVKVNDFEKRLKEALNIALNNYHQKGNKLNYKYNSYLYVINFNDILYIEKEQDSKRSVIHTTYGNEYIPKNLKEINTLLDERFLQVHRSLIINLEFVKRYNYKENMIVFKNGDTTTLIARSKKKELMQSLIDNNS